MNVEELMRRLEAYEDDSPVYIQGPNEELWPMAGWVGDADEGEIVVLPASDRGDGRDLLGEIDLLRDALRAVLASAHPHPTEHPTMHTAWKAAESVLRETGLRSTHPKEKP